MFQVAIVSRLSEHGASFARSVPPLKPRTGVGSRRTPGPCTRPSNTCKPRGHPQSKPQETNFEHLSQHSNHQLPRNQRLPLNHQTISKHYSNPKSLRGLQNSGRNPNKIPTQIQLTNGSAIRELSEKPGVVRLSRRKRGLPPETSSTPPNRFPSNNTSLKKRRTLLCNDGDVQVESYETLEEDKDVTAACLSNVGETTGSHVEEVGQDSCGHTGEVRLVKGSYGTEDLVEKVNVGQLSLTSITTLDRYQEEDNYRCDLGPVDAVDMCGLMRETRLQENQTAFSTAHDTNTRTAVSKTVTRAARVTTVTTAATNSVKSTYTPSDPPASYSAKHTPLTHTKTTNKGTSKDITKFTSPASSFSINNSKFAAEDSSTGCTEDSMKDSSYNSSTSKGSTKRLSQIKSTTSAIKTRTSPRMLLKR